MRDVPLRFSDAKKATRISPGMIVGVVQRPRQVVVAVHRHVRRVVQRARALQQRLVVAILIAR